MHLYVVGVHDIDRRDITHNVFVTAENELHAKYFVSLEAPGYRTSILHKLEKYVGVVGVVGLYERYHTRPGKIAKRNMDLCVHLVGIKDTTDSSPWFEYVILVVAEKHKAGYVSQGWATKKMKRFGGTPKPFLLIESWNGEGIQGCVFKRDGYLVFEGVK